MVDIITIPKNLWQIWIGPKPAPRHWMETWPQTHPDWDYRIIDNEYFLNRKFYNQELIDLFLTKPKDGYAGAADLIRYEVLFEHGGFMPGADAACLNNTDELWCEPDDYCYTVYENEIIRPEYVSPIYACNPGNKFLEIIIETLHKRKIEPFKPGDAAFKITGNAFLARMIREYNPKIKIFPSYYFIPQHFTQSADQRYAGPGKIYAEQNWGTTKNLYAQK